MRLCQVPGQERSLLAFKMASIPKRCHLPVQRGQGKGKRESALMAQKLALQQALKLFLMSSSFHSTNLDQSTGVIRRKSAPQVSRGRPFKALVVLFLHGGSDSFNMLVRAHIVQFFV